MNEQPIWIPKEDSNMHAFCRALGLQEDFQTLFTFSTKESALFWERCAAFCEVVWQRPSATVFEQPPPPKHPFIEARWFPGSFLNYCENALAYLPSDRPCLIHLSEDGGEDHWYKKDLLAAIKGFRQVYQQEGLGKGDRIVYLGTNRPEAVACFLAAASLGIIFSSIATDFGAQAIQDRLEQIQPKLAVVYPKYFFKGHLEDHSTHLRSILSALPSIHKVLEEPRWDTLPEGSSSQLEYTPTEFDHPLYILFSSGTTGQPKCLVHSHGGTLLQHKKELMLHTDLRPTDRLFYFTTTAWMMWNWMVSGLTVGATVVTYDGHPLFPSATRLWDSARQHEVNIFGTSARHLFVSEKKGVTISPDEPFRTVLSTGSPLLPEQYDWFYRQQKTIQLASICGGTDIVSCFFLGNPMVPVYKGWAQGRGLGMDVEAWDPQANPIQNKKGELICKQPFPSKPVGLWGDQEHERYRQSYFSRYPDQPVWQHGDYIVVDEETGSVQILGRSDATLNPGGVRIGSAEIYRVVENIQDVEDSLVFGLPDQSGKDQIILLVVRGKGSQALTTDALEKKIKETLKKKQSIHHVPQYLVFVEAIPYTKSGKKVETILRDALLEQKPPRNLEHLLNPEDFRACYETVHKNLQPR